MHMLASANYLLEAEIGPLPESFPGHRSTSSRGSVQPKLLLYGAAVENMLKAIRVAQGVCAVTGNALNGDLATHELQRYAEEAGLKPGKSEARLLRQLQDVLEAGKYPVAMKAGRNAKAWSFDYPEDVSAIWALMDHLDAVLRATGTRCMVQTNLHTLTMRQS